MACLASPGPPSLPTVTKALVYPALEVAVWPCVPGAHRGVNQGLLGLARLPLITTGRSELSKWSPTLPPSSSLG